MLTVNIKEAKTHLSRLVKDAANGKPFIIAKAGKPMVNVIPFSAKKEGSERRIGFMSGEISVPDDFDRMASGSIVKLFEGR